ncbi:MAG TPA: tetratricopeptide repeat protein, partial [Elusimicrobiota bacterium]|nr:tetratricopeptide repeat protein [Elusimicrobiota bacterium]
PRRGAAALCLLAWTARTASRKRIWRDEASLYRAGVAEAPRSPRMLSGLGTVLDREGRRREARDLYRRALESDPGHALAAYDMGKSFFEEGDLRSARAWFSQLERGSLADPDTFCFLGLIAEKEARYGDALAYYARALERDPYQLEARRNAGLLLYRLGDARESRRQLELYLEAAPPPAEAAEVRVFLERIVKP